MAPFYGTADVAYIPNGRIVGLSKIVRVVEILSRRLQTQEALTCEIARAIAAGVATKGVAVAMRAEHHCMSMRGVRQHSVAAVTSHYLGRFETDEALRVRFSQATYRDAAKA